MVLNYIWIFLFLISFVVACIKLVFLGDVEVFPKMMNDTFDSSKSGVTFALGLIGALTLWLGIMKIMEKSGMIEIVARMIAPFFKKIFPGIPDKHPVNGQIMMNFSANMLGLDNAATPLGLKAMEDLQKLNPEPEKASDAQIMFLTLNASGLTIIPVSIMAARATEGAANPADVFIPILLATFCSTMAGLVAVAWKQKINLFQKEIVLTLGTMIAAIGALLYYFSNLPQTEIEKISNISSAFILISIICFVLIYGWYKKINVYDSFIEGAKEGFESSIRIIPYIVAILVGVGLFKSSGVMGLLMEGLTNVLMAMNINADFIPSLPTALMKPLSGSGSRGMMLDTIKTYGVDSFPARLASIFQGAADTTFYILTVYFGYVKVKNTRYALSTCLIADIAGVIAGIFIGYMFFH